MIKISGKIKENYMKKLLMVLLSIMVIFSCTKRVENTLSEEVTSEINSIAAEPYFERYNQMRLPSGEPTVLHDGRGDLSEALNSYNNSIFEFAGLFSSNALKILLGEVDLLSGRYSNLDIFSLAQLDNRNLRLLRNMVYARHGYIFNSPDLISYFRRFEWYNPRLNNVDNLLTDVDRFNIQAIQAFENMNENSQNIILSNTIGVWQTSPAMASGWSDRFVFHPANRLEFYFSQMRHVSLIFGTNGSYTIRGNVLIYSVTQMYIIMNNSEIIYIFFGHQWEDTTLNIITFERPIVFKFPITNIETRSWTYDDSDEIIFSRETITIGGRDFFKMRDDVNDKF
jgi:hypothetical protein